MTVSRAWLETREFVFRRPARTSRDVLQTKTSYFLILEDAEERIGIGECAPIFGLSVEEQPALEHKISEVIYLLNHGHEPENMDVSSFPALRFALETAARDLAQGGERILFPSAFTEGKNNIRINGLIWMNDTDRMLEQVCDKVTDGFDCIKIKVGAQDFRSELTMLKEIRQTFGNKLILRLDANGAFLPGEAMKKLEALAEFDIHSIEQPIRAGQHIHMRQLCKNSPIPIALDEELIGISAAEARTLLDGIAPPYIILKPTLLGGIDACERWISMARQSGTAWWVTSALESNIGLNAIAQWIAIKENPLSQGLGTGRLFKNNFVSPLELSGQLMHFDPSVSWDYHELLK